MINSCVTLAKNIIFHLLLGHVFYDKNIYIYITFALLFNKAAYGSRIDLLKVQFEIFFSSVSKPAV